MSANRSQIIAQIQALYPRIYMACHVEHIKKRSSKNQISARDAAILAHLSEPYFQSPKILAAHLNIAPSTLSESLHQLAALGMVAFKSEAQDARRTQFTVTQLGKQAIAQNSVLDAQKLDNLLATMPTADQQQVIKGLKLLADAALK